MLQTLEIARDSAGHLVSLVYHPAHDAAAEPTQAVTDLWGRSVTPLQQGRFRLHDGSVVQRSAWPAPAEELDED